MIENRNFTRLFMLLIASRRKLSTLRRKKRRLSDQMHYLGVSKSGPSNASGLTTDIGQAVWLSHVARAGAAQGVLIYIHGFNTPQKTMLSRYYNLKSSLRRQGYKGAVIAFDWPIFDNIFQYSADRKLAEEVAPSLLSDIVAPLRANVPGAKIHIVAHSMGAWLTMAALRKLSEGGLPGFTFDQICFASADVPAKDFQAGSADRAHLTNACKRFTNYCSSSDRVLKFAGGLVNSFEGRLGKEGLPRPVGGETFDAEGRNRFAQIKKNNSRSHSHSWWWSDALFFRDLCQTLKQTAPSAVTTRAAHPPPSHQLLRAKL
ncbi:MAG: alpha/beta fold hydrolase [Paracoccaceae bacterium]